MTGISKVPLAKVGFLAMRVSTLIESLQEEFNPAVLLKWPDRAVETPQHMRLDDFLIDNESTLTVAEIQAICDHLLAKKVYSGGGGSGERWTLEVAG